MYRYAVIDLGTNTFHLLIAEDGGVDGFREVYRERRFVKLAEKGIKTIDDDAFERGLIAMNEFHGKLKEFQVNTYRALGTAALRTASNGQEFMAEIKNQTGIDIEVISGSREARLIYQGVKNIVPIEDGNDLIMDIGGGSVEFIIARDSGIVWSHSFPIGIAVLFHKFHKEDPISEEEKEAIKQFLDSELTLLIKALKQFKVNRLIGAAGSFDVLHQLSAQYDEQKSFSISLDQFKGFYHLITSTTIKERLQMGSIPEKRILMVVVAFILMQYILDKSEVSEIVFSPFSLKEGVLLQMIASESKDRDGAFRIFYNQSIYPELVRLENYRKQLIGLLIFSAVLALLGMKQLKKFAH